MYPPERLTWTVESPVVRYVSVNPRRKRGFPKEQKAEASTMSSQCHAAALSNLAGTKTQRSWPTKPTRMLTQTNEPIGPFVRCASTDRKLANFLEQQKMDGKKRSSACVNYFEGKWYEALQASHCSNRSNPSNKHMSNMLRLAKPARARLEPTLSAFL